MQIDTIQQGRSTRQGTGRDNLLGFVILTHDNPPQILRLINRLVSMFGNPPIVCHHDFSKCDLDTNLFPPNVTFVQPHLVTARARWSLVEAMIAGLRVLYEREDVPEWFILLSGADYPIKPAKVVLAELKETAYDAFVEYVPIDPGAPQTDYQKRCVWRYFRRHIQLPASIQRFMPFCENRALPEWFPHRPLPFSEHFRCYAGSQFFTANHKCVQHILAWHSTQRALADHYYLCRVPVPDESYIQCILCNESSLRIPNDNKRYIDWSTETGKPKALTMTDLPALLRSPAHFARKFDMRGGNPILDRLDETISNDCN